MGLNEGGSAMKEIRPNPTGLPVIDGSLHQHYCAADMRPSEFSCVLLQSGAILRYKLWRVPFLRWSEDFSALLL